MLISPPKDNKVIVRVTMKELMDDVRYKIKNLFNGYEDKEIDVVIIEPEEYERLFNSK